MIEIAATVSTFLIGFCLLALACERWGIARVLGLILIAIGVGGLLGF